MRYRPLSLVPGARVADTCCATRALLAIGPRRRHPPDRPRAPDDACTTQATSTLHPPAGTGHHPHEAYGLRLRQVNQPPIASLGTYAQAAWHMERRITSIP